MIPTFVRRWFLQVEIDYLRAYGMFKNEWGTVSYIAERHAKKRIRVQVMFGQRLPPLGFPGTFILPILILAVVCLCLAFAAVIDPTLGLPAPFVVLLGCASIYLFALAGVFISWGLPFVRSTHSDLQSIYQTLLDKRLSEWDALR